MYLAIGAGSIPVLFLINDDDARLLVKSARRASDTIRTEALYGGVRGGDPMPRGKKHMCRHAATRAARARSRGPALAARPRPAARSGRLGPLDLTVSHARQARVSLNRASLNLAESGLTNLRAAHAAHRRRDARAQVERQLARAEEQRLNRREDASRKLRAAVRAKRPDRH